MNFYYCDTGLKDESGHHAGECQFLSTILSDHLGLNVIKLGHKTLDEKIKNRINAIPHFNVYTYGVYKPDIVSGELNDYLFKADLLCHDLLQLNNLSGEDVFYFSSVLPFHIRGIHLWMQRKFSVENAPLVIIFPGFAPGVTIEPDTGRLNSFNLESVCFRSSSLLLNKGLSNRFRFIYYDRYISRIFSSLLSRQVTYVPMPYHHEYIKENHDKNTPITIGFLGHQTDARKGYQLVPEIVEKILATYPEVSIVVQNSEPSRMQAITDKLAAIQDPRLKLVFSSLDEDGWHHLYDEIDIVVLPYKEGVYNLRTSGIARECFAYGKLIVVPENSLMHRHQNDYGFPALVFSSSDTDSIVKSISHVIDNYDQLNMQTEDAAIRWRKAHEVSNFTQHFNSVLDNHQIQEIY